MGLDLETLRSFREALPDRADPRWAEAPSADYRDHVLEALQMVRPALDFDPAQAPQRVEDDLVELPEHTLVVWTTDADSAVWLYAVPQEAINEELEAALERAQGTAYAEPGDVSSAADWIALARIRAALDLGEFDGAEDLKAVCLEEGLEEWPDEEVDDAPDQEELDELFGAWSDFAIETASDLDVRITRCFAFHQLQ